MERNFNTVLFDLDGTLVDSRTDLSNAVNHALETVGRPRQPEKKIIPYVGNGLKSLISSVLGKSSPETLEVAVKAFEDFYNDHCVDKTVLYEQVFDSLKVLSNRAKLGIVTNKPFRFAEKIVRQLGIQSFLTVIIGGDSTPEKKPHPTPILEGVKRTGGNCSETILVGDGHQDMLAGRAAGLFTCAARYGYGFTPLILDYGPDFIIDRFEQLKEIVL